MPRPSSSSEPSFWAMKVNKIGLIKFKSTKYGRLGVKTSSKPVVEKQKTYSCPKCKGELADTFRGKYCPTDKKYFLESEAVISFRDRKTGKEYTWDQFKNMFPKTKEATVVAIVDSKKINYGITDSMSSYFLVPVNEYENILKYNQLVYLLKENNLTAIMSPMTLVEGSETKHVYSVFADLNRNGLIAVELLKKEGLREIPEEALYTESVESPAQVVTVKKKLYKKQFKF